jgi:hypothetical protein
MLHQKQIWRTFKRESPPYSHYAVRLEFNLSANGKVTANDVVT